MTSWRRTLYAMWIAQALTIFGFSMRSPFLPFFLGELGAETFEQQALWAGVINSAGAGTMALSAPIWGIAADRYGRKPMVLRALFIGAFVLWPMALATSPWHLLALRVMEGGFTGIVAASTALVATAVPRERLGHSLGLMQTAIFSGAAIGPLLGGLLADLVGYRNTFLIAGAMPFIGGLVVLVLVKEEFQRPAPAAGGGRGSSMTALLLGSTMLAMILIMLILRLVSFAVHPIMPLYVEQLSRSSEGVASLSGLTVGAMGLSSAIAAVAIGRLADRLDQRMILMSTAGLAGLLYLPQAVVSSVSQLIVLQFLFGLAAGGVMPTANAVVARLTPDARRGAVYGFLSTAQSVGGFIGPLAGSALAAAVSIRSTFLASGVLMLLAVLLVWRVLPARDPEPSPQIAGTSGGSD